MVAKLRERLAVNKKAAQKFEGERFNLRKLNELEVKENYQIPGGKTHSQINHILIDRCTKFQGS